jgi:hypothetical protein
MPGSDVFSPDGRCLVDVAGIEPATPCLQSIARNTMWLILLAFTYVIYHGFRGCLELIVPILFLHCRHSSRLVLRFCDSGYRYRFPCNFRIYI